MVYCTKCGTENDDEALTCKNCGASLRPPPYRSYTRRYEDDLCFGRRGGSSWVIIIGIFIILVGISSILGETLGLNVWNLLWPFFIIGIGILIVVNALYRR